MSTLSLFTIEVYTVTLERSLLERRREAERRRLCCEATAGAQPPTLMDRRPKGHRPGRLAGVH